MHGAVTNFGHGQQIREMPVLKQKVLQAFFCAALRWGLWFPRRCAQIILCGITATRHFITRSAVARAVLGSGVAVVPSRGIRSPLLSESGSLSVPTAVRAYVSYSWSTCC
ncbi:exo-alpha-sialidase [Trypanosoma cruzi]|nr:exo-alpha-sialidase [Trypanosoma cruzi]